MKIKLLESLKVLVRNDVHAKMRKLLFIVVVLILLFILVYSANFYFLSRLSSSVNTRFDSKSQLDSQAFPIFDEADIKLIYRTKNPKFDQIRNKILENFTPCERNKNYSEIWDVANKVSWDLVLVI